jgi:uracil-DNA glycosylase family 4
MNKLEEMRKLSDKRREALSSERTEGLPEKTREELLKEGFLDVSDICKGLYDTRDFVSPYSKTACNLNADVMLIGQDWSSQDTLENYPEEKAKEVAKNGYDADIPTNKNLQDFLGAFNKGAFNEKEKLKLNFSDCYATNLFVFIKPKKISSPIKKKYFIECAKEYTLPEIAIVKPKIVICLGSQVFKVLSKIMTGSEKTLKDYNRPIYDAKIGTHIIGVYHPGGLGTKAAGGKENAKKHWEKIGEFYRPEDPIASV